MATFSFCDSPYVFYKVGHEVRTVEFYESEDTNLLRRIISWITDIIVVIAFACFSVYAFGTQVPINGSSMQPVLKTGDVVLMNRLIYDFQDPNRFDVVAFRREDGKMIVKRVIGLPGEKVQIGDGQIYINDKLLYEAEQEMPAITSPGMAEHPIELGEEEYFLLGDNRDSSEDSRFANVGNVKRDKISGKVWLRLFPILDMGLVD